MKTIKENLIELEANIFNIRTIINDCELLFTDFCDRPKPLTEDEISNRLLGITTLGNARLDKIANILSVIFEQLQEKNHEP